MAGVPNLFTISYHLGIVPYQAKSGPPQKAYKGPLMAIYKKSYVMLHFKAEWTSKQNILTADTILAEPGL